MPMIKAVSVLKSVKRITEAYELTGVKLEAFHRMEIIHKDEKTIMKHLKKYNKTIASHPCENRFFRLVLSNHRMPKHMGLIHHGSVPQG